MRVFRLLFIILSQALTASVAYEWETKYYSNRVDHLSFTTDSRYEQKFLINWDSFRSGGPIFFYAGNEGDIENFAENTGFMWELAPELGAVLIFAEHRYYGESMPFGNDSLSTKENRAYLSSEQALADFAELLHHLRHADGDTRLRTSPVVAFGGSYGGMLAAWFRTKYPHIVQGAIAASAPVVQFQGFTPCETFNDIVRRDFHAATPSGRCDERFGQSFKLLKAAAQQNDLDQLSKTWKLCKPLKNSTDVDGIIDYLVDLFGNVAMVNYPYAANFIMDLPANPVQAMCAAMDASSAKKVSELVFDGFQVAINHTGKLDCWDVSTSSAQKLGTAAWDFQACTEMVMPMCTKKANKMFPESKWDLEAYTEKCLGQFSVRPRPDMAMINYGSNWLQAASNIVFSNGDLDPWSGGGVYKNLTGNSVFSILIKDGAHHLDLRGSNPAADPPSVTRARDFERDRIREWIAAYQSVTADSLM